jgi:4-diphosphocytidyl-2-C-methyl-D-erythritol kinase
LTRTARAPAKLNLYLEILGRRSDGFHELETLMLPISLADSLAFTPTAPPANGEVGEIQLDIRRCLPVRPPPALDAIPTGPTNLVVKALELLRARSGCRCGARVELVKRIPAAAGLGGASSDTATALQLANRGWQLNWPQSRLADLAAEIGADVPFFLHGHPAICRGRGERVEPLWGISPLHFVIVKPPAALKTAEVYAAHDRLRGTAPRVGSGQANQIAAALASKCWRERRDSFHNRLQAAAATLTPWVERLRAIFDRLDCLAHQLTGSGSAYFGVCRHAQHARRLAAWLRTRQPGLVYPTRSCR